MSLEDVGSTLSLAADSVASDHCDSRSLSQGPDQEQEQGQDQDGIFLDRIASLSLDMFEPSDFTGRFSKIHARSRKRTRIGIIGGTVGRSTRAQRLLAFKARQDSTRSE